MCTGEYVAPKRLNIKHKKNYLRISARLGWTQNCKEPEQTRQALEAWLPEDRYLAAISC